MLLVFGKSEKIYRRQQPPKSINVVVSMAGNKRTTYQILDCKQIITGNFSCIFPLRLCYFQIKILINFKGILIKKTTIGTNYWWKDGLVQRNGFERMSLSWPSHMKPLQHRYRLILHWQRFIILETFGISIPGSWFDVARGIICEAYNALICMTEPRRNSVPQWTNGGGWKIDASSRPPHSKQRWHGNVIL